MKSSTIHPAPRRYPVFRAPRTTSVTSALFRKMVTCLGAAAWAAGPWLHLVACGGGGEASLPANVATPESSGASGATSNTASLPLSTIKLTGLSKEEDEALDRSVSPCDNFYQFACGSWIKRATIPDDEPAWYRGFSTIREKNENTLRTILEKATEKSLDRRKNLSSAKTEKPKNRTKLEEAKGPRPTPSEEPSWFVNLSAEEKIEQKLGDFYFSCMDEQGAEKRGLKPIEIELKKIKKIHDVKSAVTVLGELHNIGVPALWGLGSQQSFADANKVVGAMGQAGLGMPDRDYYLKSDKKTLEIRAEYKKYVAKLFTLASEKKAESMAADVLAVETELARVSMSKEELREPKKLDHLTTVKEWMASAGNVWEPYFTKFSLDVNTPINVSQPSFTSFAASIPAGSNTFITMTQFKHYLEWQLLNHAAPLLSRSYVDAWFDWSRSLRGTKKLPPRWKRCVRAADGVLGEMLAIPFVKQTLGDSGKADAKEMIRTIEEVMKTNIDSLSWMDTATKVKAQEKLMKVVNKIAYPDVWRNYDSLHITPDSVVANMMRFETFEMKRQLSKIGKPVDKKEWSMTPPMVNAYYEPTNNEMVFPAGILQPPFYAQKRPKEVNYGGIGMVMGHELIHGFDDEGRQFDAFGNLANWWTETTNKEFESRASCVKNQFDSYELLGEHINGLLTLGENIADLGGLKLAYGAMLADSEQNTKKTKEEGEISAEQHFFISFAQSWCGSRRDEYARLLVKTDPHSPPEFRVNGPLSNMPEFAQAFACEKGKGMMRVQACAVW